MKIRASRPPAPGIGLEALVDDYLKEKVELGLMRVQRAALFHAQLVGLTSPDVIGFTRFLQAKGISEPSARDLVSATVGDYYEYLLQYHGLRRSSQAMRALRNFWIWCKKNGLTRETRMPPDLRQAELAPLRRS